MNNFEVCISLKYDYLLELIIFDHMRLLRLNSIIYLHIDLYLNDNF